MPLSIRPPNVDDHDAVVALAMRAWAPVYPSVNAVLGHELAALLHGNDWHAHQADEVREVLRAEGTAAWVGELDGVLAGFVAARVVDLRRLIGEISIVAVDPASQRTGVGTTLIETALTWLRNQAMKVAYVSTGGDPGHQPARHLYERLGFRLFPSAQYFKTLG
jgi:GNAT superfamily N-acetyltransferase